MWCGGRFPLGRIRPSIDQLAGQPRGRDFLGSGPRAVAAARPSLDCCCSRTALGHVCQSHWPLPWHLVFTMVFGTLAQSFEAARRLHHRHASIEGTLQSAAGPFPAGSFYYANEVSALRWVHATLVETALMAYALILPALTKEQRERYYAESRLFAALFGIPKAHLARDWTAFSAYTEAMTRSSTLTVTDPARVMAHRLLAGADTWLPIPAGYKALTAALLPPRLRDAFALRSGKAEQDEAQHFIAWARRFYPFLPSRLRYVGPYQEAEQRLAGRTQPDLVARLCNRFWMGQSALGRWPA